VELVRHIMSQVQRAGMGGARYRFRAKGLGAEVAGLAVAGDPSDEFRSFTPCRAAACTVRGRLAGTQAAGNAQHSDDSVSGLAFRVQG
jgi:hypothetical protein